MENQQIQLVDYQNQNGFGYIQQNEDFRFLILETVFCMLSSTPQSWLFPLLQSILLYVLSQIGRELKNRELKGAYVELGQTQTGKCIAGCAKSCCY